MDILSLIYVLLGIAINFIWGLAFFVPYYLSHIDPALIVLSRYFFYGIISLFLLCLSGGHWRSLTTLDWKKAMLFSFAGNLGYYFLLVLGIHFAGIVLPTLIVGALPMTMMIYSNLQNKEFPFSKLALPLILISIGIIGIKILQHSDNTPANDSISIIAGTVCSILALGIWTWFGVANANYLKQNFRISGYTWSLAIGVCCLVQVILFMPFYTIIKSDAVYTVWANQKLFYQLILGGLLLGVIVSWLATIGWNKVSQKLPTTFIGQLLVFETIASLLYGYIHDQVIPSLVTIIFILITLIGIVLGIRVTIFNKNRKQSLINQQSL